MDEAVPQADETEKVWHPPADGFRTIHTFNSAHCVYCSSLVPENQVYNCLFLHIGCFLGFHFRDTFLAKYCIDESENYRRKL